MSRMIGGHLETESRDTVERCRSLARDLSVAMEETTERTFPLSKHYGLIHALWPEGREEDRQVLKKLDEQ